MKRIFNFALISLNMLMISCTAVKTNANQTSTLQGDASDIMVKEASYYLSKGGIQGNTWNKYTIIIKTTLKDLKVDNLWLDPNQEPITVSISESTEMDGEKFKYKLIVLYAQQKPHFLNVEKRALDIPKEKFQGEAMVFYTINGERKYIVIDKLTRKKKKVYH